jgi:hypothetical protein
MILAWYRRLRKLLQKPVVEISPCIRLQTHKAQAPSKSYFATNILTFQSPTSMHSTESLRRFFTSYSVESLDKITTIFHHYVHQTSLSQVATNTYILLEADGSTEAFPTKTFSARTTIIWIFLWILHTNSLFACIFCLFIYRERNAIRNVLVYDKKEMTAYLDIVVRLRVVGKMAVAENFCT